MAKPLTEVEIAGMLADDLRRQRDQETEALDRYRPPTIERKFDPSQPRNPHTGEWLDTHPRRWWRAANGTPTSTRPKLSGCCGCSTATPPPESPPTYALEVRGR